MNTGQIIKQLRKEKKLTQEELGNLLGVKKNAIQKYENGSIQNFKISTVKSICAIFKVPPWIILFPEYIKIHGFSEEEYISHIFNHDYKVQSYYKYLHLNETGRKKAIDYIEDLLQIEHYRYKMKQDLTSDKNEKDS